MPIKNVIKDYKPNSYYHLYNLGIDNRTIFESEADYEKFLSFIAEALTPPPSKEDTQREITINGKTFQGSPRQPKNLFGAFELHAFCIMPTHFHFLVKQKELNGIETFMRSLGTRYVMYFNKTQKRRGPLFQGTYKAIHLENEAMILHLSRFIHRKPFKSGTDILTHHSSYAAYKDKLDMPWVTKSQMTAILERDTFLKSMNPTYTDFVEHFKEDSSKVLGDLTLED